MIFPASCGVPFRFTRRLSGVFFHSTIPHEKQRYRSGSHQTNKMKHWDAKNILVALISANAPHHARLSGSRRQRRYCSARARAERNSQEARRLDDKIDLGLSGAQVGRQFGEVQSLGFLKWGVSVANPQGRAASFWDVSRAPSTRRGNCSPQPDPSSSGI